MATISKKEVHKFLDKHPDIPFSAAKFEYSSYLESEAVEYANAISAKAFIRRELKQIKRKITGIRNSADAMDKRKTMKTGRISLEKIRFIFSCTVKKTVAIGL